MSFKRVFISFLFFLMLGSSFVIHAATVECGSIGVCRGGCTSLQLTCGSQNGFVEYETPLDSLKVVVTRRDGQQEEHVLKNPPGGIGDYHAEVGQNSWVMNQLRAKNLQYGDTVEVHHKGYGVKSGIPLYEDWSTNEQIGVTGEETDDKGAQKPCWYISRPNVVSSKTCGTICMSGIFCKINGIEYTGQTLCKALKNGKACPTATKCAVDAVLLPVGELGLMGLGLGGSGGPLRLPGGGYEIKIPPATNFDKFGDPIKQSKEAPGKEAPADASGGSQSDSTGGNTSSGNDDGGTLQ